MSAYPSYLMSRTAFPETDGHPTLSVKVPGRNQHEARDFLNSVHGGSLLGAGRASSVDFIGLRDSYETHAKALRAEVQSMKASGATEEQIARYVAQERTNFARMTRLKQGPGALVTLEIRDNRKYGLGGRTYENLARKADRDIAAGRKFAQGLTREQIVIEGAMRPQDLMNAKFLKAAKYLKYGGPIMLVVGAGLTAHEVASAPKAERAHILTREAGGFVGGEIAAEVAAIALLTVGTGGLGLVAIAGVALAGVAGGVVGSLVADKLYYAAHSGVAHRAMQTGQVWAHELRSMLPDFWGGAHPAHP